MPEYWFVQLSITIPLSVLPDMSGNTGWDRAQNEMNDKHKSSNHLVNINQT